MIPYQDLVAALRHWRARNGLPNVGADVGPAPASAASLAPRMGAPLPRAAPMAPMAPMAPVAPPQPLAETIDVEEEIEAHEIQSEDVYEAPGDFSMSFGDAAAEPAGDESTSLGGPPPAPAPYGDFGDDFEQEQAAMAAAQRDGTRPGIGIGGDDGKSKKKKR